jgi:hypothetical protein
LTLFFHIGMHKTGTTFLQSCVFPKWTGIEYIRWPNLEYFLRLREGRNYLVSREGLSGEIWSPQEERERSIRRLAELFPQARILMSFRRHDRYIASSYKQYLHRGGTGRFDEFFDIETDRGFHRQADLYYRPKIESIERHFGHTPFVFLHEELRDALPRLLEDLQAFIGGQAPAPSEIRMRYANRGVKYYPGKLLRWLNGWSRSELNPLGRYRLDNAYTRSLKIDPRTVCQYWLAFLPDRPTLHESTAERIRERYRDDWDFIRALAQRRRELAGGFAPQSADTARSA